MKESLWGPKCVRPPKELCFFSCDEKSLAIAISFCHFSRKQKKRAHRTASLAGDGDVCDRKLQRFAVTVFGALRSLASPASPASGVGIPGVPRPLPRNPPKVIWIKNLLLLLSVLMCAEQLSEELEQQAEFVKKSRDTLLQQNTAITCMEVGRGNESEGFENGVSVE